jgi:hypothetical protein
MSGRAQEFFSETWEIAAGFGTGETQVACHTEHWKEAMVEQ